MFKVCGRSVILIGLLSGCTTVWINGRVDALPLAEAKMHCEGVAHQRFPVKNEVAQRSVVWDEQGTTVSSEGNERKHHPWHLRREKMESYIMDVNKPDRDAVFEQCMADDGWIKERRWGR